MTELLGAFCEEAPCLAQIELKGQCTLSELLISWSNNFRKDLPLHTFATSDSWTLSDHLCVKKCHAYTHFMFDEGGFCEVDKQAKN